VTIIVGGVQSHVTVIVGGVQSHVTVIVGGVRESCDCCSGWGPGDT